MKTRCPPFEEGDRVIPTEGTTRPIESSSDSWVKTTITAEELNNMGGYLTVAAVFPNDNPAPAESDWLINITGILGAFDAKNFRTLRPEPFTHSQ